MQIEGREKLIALMRELDEMRVLEQVAAMQLQGVLAHDIFLALLDGVKEVDALYEKGRYFIADLVMAGHILKNVVTKMLGFYRLPQFGRILFAAARRGDQGVTHSVAAEVLRQNAFDVLDIERADGESLVRHVREFRPHVLILTGDRSAVGEEMTSLIRALDTACLRQDLIILAGGPGITQQLAETIGADAGSGTVMGCLRYCYERMASQI